MKKIIPIFLFIIICISHLNIIDAVIDFSNSYKKELEKVSKNFLVEEESETEKENKGKEKVEEQEKYYSRHTYPLAGQFQLSDKDKFSCFNTRLNAHPFQEDDIQPPKAV